MQQLRRSRAADPKRVENDDREDHVIRDAEEGRRQPRENEEVIDDCHDQETEDLRGNRGVRKELCTFLERGVMTQRSPITEVACFLGRVSLSLAVVAIS